MENENLIKRTSEKPKQLSWLDKKLLIIIRIFKSDIPKPTQSQKSLSRVLKSNQRPITERVWNFVRKKWWWLIFVVFFFPKSFEFGEIISFVMWYFIFSWVFGN